jgi:hypothetical protein
VICAVNMDYLAAIVAGMARLIIIAVICQILVGHTVRTPIAR